MSIPALSTAGFTQYVTASSNISASQQALNSLQQSLGAGNLTAAQAAFNIYQTLNHNLAQTSGTAAASNSQLSSDLTALGSDIASGDLSAAQSAFATVKSDLGSTPSQQIVAAEAAAAQTVKEIESLLSTFSTSSSTSTSADPTTDLLDSAYGVNASGTTTDPTIALLESKYGTSETAASSSTPDSTSSGSGVSIYA